MPGRGNLSLRLPPTLSLGLALLFLGALLWAGQRDAFHWVWFKIHHSQGAAKGVVVLPKTQSGPLPVVIFLHGSGGTVLASGNDLRGISEMGIAAVGMDYCQTNEARFEAEFTALLDYVRRQRWADMTAKVCRQKKFELFSKPS